MPRIVSMLASGTEIVHLLGLSDGLIGISHECDHPPELMDRPRLSRPRFDPAGLESGEIDRRVREVMLEFGSVYAVDADLLERLDPDLVLAQAVCEVCAVPTMDVCDLIRTRGIDARVESLDAHTVDEVLASIVQVGRAAGIREHAEAVVDRLQHRIDAVRESVHGLPRPRVLALEWLDPPFLPGHWVPEMIEIAGGVNLAGDAGRPSVEVPWTEVAGLDPDVLLIMPCGYDLEASTRDADRQADRLKEIAPRAVASGRAFVVNGSAYFNRSGPRVVDGIEALAALLNGGETDAARVWRG